MLMMSACPQLLSTTSPRPGALRRFGKDRSVAGISMIIQAGAWSRRGVPVTLYGQAAPRTGRLGPLSGRDGVDASARSSSWTIRAYRCDSPT